MFEHEDGEVLNRVIRHVKQPARLDPALDDRVMAAIRVLDASRPLARPQSGIGAAWRWLVTPRRIAVPPLGGLAAAAALAALLVVRPWTAGRPDPRVSAVDFQFVLVAPRAGAVSLVGDFNDWDPGRTPMRAVRTGDLWSVVVPLAPGRYRYAFLVDGASWRADPAAPRAADDEFGHPSSVVTVGGS